MRKSLIYAVAGFLVLGLFIPRLGAQDQEGRPPKKTKAAQKLPVRLQHPKAVEKEVLRLTNEVRRKNHLSPLDPDDALTATARAHSDDMLKRDFFDHVNPDGQTPKDRFPTHSMPASGAGENIWKGSGHDYADAKLIARLLVDSWMSSPGHRANMLKPEFTHLGVGVTVAASEVRATQVFAVFKSGK